MLSFVNTHLVATECIKKKFFFLFRTKCYLNKFWIKLPDHRSFAFSTLDDPLSNSRATEGLKRNTPTLSACDRRYRKVAIGKTSSKLSPRFFKAEEHASGSLIAYAIATVNVMSEWKCARVCECSKKGVCAEEQNWELHSRGLYLGLSKSTTAPPWCHETLLGGVLRTLTSHMRLIVLPFFTYTSSGPTIVAWAAATHVRNRTLKYSVSASTCAN